MCLIESQTPHFISPKNLKAKTSLLTLLLLLSEESHYEATILELLMIFLSRWSLCVCPVQIPNFLGPFVDVGLIAEV